VELPFERVFFLFFFSKQKFNQKIYRRAVFILLLVTSYNWRNHKSNKELNRQKIKGKKKMEGYPNSANPKQIIAPSLLTTGGVEKKKFTPNIPTRAGEKERKPL
jgi:hypothetical protein